LAGLEVWVYLTIACTVGELHVFPLLISSFAIGLLNSTFSDIFDEAHFINTLQADVRIIRELPKELESVPRARKHFSSWASVNYYEEMTDLWKDYQVDMSLRFQYI